MPVVRAVAELARRALAGGRPRARARGTRPREAARAERRHAPRQRLLLEGARGHAGGHPRERADPARRGPRGHGGARGTHRPRVAAHRPERGAGGGPAAGREPGAANVGGRGRDGGRPGAFDAGAGGSAAAGAGGGVRPGAAGRTAAGTKTRPTRRTAWERMPPTGAGSSDGAEKKATPDASSGAEEPTLAAAAGGRHQERWRKRHWRADSIGGRPATGIRWCCTWTRRRWRKLRTFPRERLASRRQCRDRGHAASAFPRECPRTRRPSRFRGQAATTFSRERPRARGPAGSRAANPRYTRKCRAGQDAPVNGDGAARPARVRGHGRRRLPAARPCWTRRGASTSPRRPRGAWPATRPRSACTTAPATRSSMSAAAPGPSRQRCAGRWRPATGSAGSRVAATSAAMSNMPISEHYADVRPDPPVVQPGAAVPATMTIGINHFVRSDLIDIQRTCFSQLYPTFREGILHDCKIRLLRSHLRTGAS